MIGNQKDEDEKGRPEDTDRCNECSPQTVKFVANEGGGNEDGTWSDLTQSNTIQEFLGGDPVESINGLILYERKSRVPTAKGKGSDLGKDQKERSHGRVNKLPQDKCNDH